MLNISDIRKLFVQEYQKENFVIDKTGVKTIEIVGQSFLVDEDSIFGQPNYQYIQKELQWYESQSLNVHDIPETPKIWLDVADSSGFINSNYGWCIFSAENGNQYQNCLAELKRNTFSRRATMIYTRPSMWADYNRNNMSDFMCTYAQQFFIRNNKLISYYLMRSQDTVFGFNNDVSWGKHVMKKLAKDLNIESENLYWTSASLHLYERHFYLIEHFIKTGEKHISKKEYKKLYHISI